MTTNDPSDRKWKPGKPRKPKPERPRMKVTLRPPAVDDPVARAKVVAMIAELLGRPDKK